MNTADCSRMSKTKVKHVFRDGLNCGGTDWYPMATYVLFQSALSVKTTNACVQAAPTTSVQAPNHTRMIRGRAASLLPAGRGATAPPGSNRRDLIGGWTGKGGGQCLLLAWLQHQHISLVMESL